MRVILLSAVFVLVPWAHSAEPAKPAKPPEDPWVGSYYKFNRSWANKEGERFTISKHEDGSYRLSGKGYDTFKFKEVEKGVISDGKGGIGKLILGETKFADGTKNRVIRAEFCYEQFILHDTWGDAARR